MKDDLGDRMKGYEATVTSQAFSGKLPIYARIDGRAFSSLTRHLHRPFDTTFSTVMRSVTRELVRRTHARVGYVQSDEISLVWLNESEETQPLFGGKVHKLTSVIASLSASLFQGELFKLSGVYHKLHEKHPHFDARVMELPSKIEAANMFLWRTQDAERNFILNVGQSVFSHHELQHKNISVLNEMLCGRDANWKDQYSPWQRFGSWYQIRPIYRLLTNEELGQIPVQHRPDPETLVRRNECHYIPVPSFRTVTNRVEVIFDRADPITTSDAPETP